MLKSSTLKRGFEQRLELFNVTCLNVVAGSGFHCLCLVKILTLALQRSLFEP